MVVRVTQYSAFINRTIQLKVIKIGNFVTIYVYFIPIKIFTNKRFLREREGRGSKGK